MECVKVKNLSFAYPGREERALKNISFSVGPGELVTLCGKSGSGKTTLLSLLKPEIAPKGRTEGGIMLFGVPSDTLGSGTGAGKIGFIRQNVDFQLITHSVRSELAFGLECIGEDSAAIGRSIAEVSDFFSLSDMLDKPVTSLSGGEKQLLCLASVCAMHPDLIILDEPMSRLDPVYTDRLLSALRKLCDEFSVSVIIGEHRLEPLVPITDRILSLENGELVFDGKPSELTRYKNGEDGFLFRSMPLQMRLSSFLGEESAALTIAEGRKLLEKRFPSPKVSRLDLRETETAGEAVLEASHIYFAYDPGEYVLKDLSVKLERGRIFALMGENGSGKSTALKLFSGMLRSRRGKLRLFGVDAYRRGRGRFEGVSVLPQSCEALFAGPTILDDLMSVAKNFVEDRKERLKTVLDAAEEFDIADILSSHPYDVSGGEMQRSALAMAMLSDPDLLFLDEPTQGMDVLFKAQLSEKLKELAGRGKTVFIVSHDTSFVAETADEAALLFDGEIIARGSTEEFFSSNHYFTTTACRLSRGRFESVVTEEQLFAICEKNL